MSAGFDLDALERALTEATPGPWRIDVDDDDAYVSTIHIEALRDAALIVQSVNALPGLIGEVRRLREEERKWCDAGALLANRASAAEADRATLVAEHNALRASLNDVEAERDALRGRLAQEGGKASPWYAACQRVKAERDAAEEVGTRQRDRAKAAEAERDALKAKLAESAKDRDRLLRAIRDMMDDIRRAPEHDALDDALSTGWRALDDKGDDPVKAERDALRKHRDELCAELRRVTDEKHQVFRKERDALRARVERLEAVVRRYAFAGEDCRSCARYDVHHDECPVGAALESSDE